MFEELAGYIKGIVFFSLFANLILDFMPNINYKKYIKVLIGILLIIVILKPILNFDFLLNEINDKVDDVSFELNNDLQVDEKINEMETKIYERILEGENFERWFIFAVVWKYKKNRTYKMDNAWNSMSIIDCKFLFKKRWSKWK